MGYIENGVTKATCFTFDKFQGANNAILSGVAEGIDFSGDRGEVIIPASATVQGVICDVIGISYKAFAERTDIKKISIPSTVSILTRGETQGVFANCSNLKVVTFGYPATTMSTNTNALKIHSNDFDGCSNLKKLYFDYYNATDNLRLVTPYGGIQIEEYAFKDKINLQGIYYKDKEGHNYLGIPRYVSSIGKEAFSGCTALETLYIDETDIGERAFFGCSGLTWLKIVGNWSQSIESQAFAACTKLSTIYLSGRMSDLPDDIFQNDNKIKSIDIGSNVNIEWPKHAPLFESPALLSITGDHSYSKMLCNSDKTTLWRCPRALQLDTLEIPDFITAIAEGAFSETTVRRVERPLDISVPLDLAEKAFKNASALEEAIFDSEVWLNRQVFEGCANLQQLKIAPNSKFLNLSMQQPDTSYVSLSLLKTVQCPANGLMAIQYAPNITTLTITDGTIDNDVFSNHENIQTVTIGKDVTTLGSSFQWCIRLRGVFINNPDINIEGEPFQNSVNIRQATIPMQAIDIVDRAKSAVLTLTITSGDILTKSFYGYTSLQKLHLQGSVTTIGDAAFAECPELQYVTTTAMINRIGHKAFAGCVKLLDFSSADTVSEQIWGNRIFEGCKNLGPVFIIPEYVTKTDEGIFYGCTSLEEIRSSFLGAKMTTYVPLSTSNYDYTLDSWFAFYDIEGSLNISKSPKLKKVCITKDTILSQGAFSNWIGLQWIQLPRNITNLPSLAFSNCSSLVCVSDDLVRDEDQPKIYLPALTSIGNNAFQGCSAIKDFQSSSYLKSIGSDAFRDCTSIQDFTFPNTLESIGDNAFNGCSNSKMFSFPDSVTTIGEHIMVRCDAVEDIQTPFIGADKNTPCSLTDWFMYIDEDNQLIGGYPTKLSNVTVTKATTLSQATFSNFSALSSVILTNSSISTIPQNAFNSCSSLQKVQLPYTLTSIGASAFAYCPSLTELSIPYGVTAIGSLAFQEAGITKITLPTAVTSIGKQAFYGAKNLGEVTIPKTLTKIGELAFAGCRALTKVSIDQDFVGDTKLRTIDSKAFLNCIRLSDTSFVETVREFGTQAFYGCSGITEFIIPKDAFYYAGVLANCNNLTKLTIPRIAVVDSSNPHIGQLFGSADPDTQGNYLPQSLTKIEITNIQTIPTKAFYGCNNLEIIELNTNIIEINDRAFEGCTKLNSLNIPSSVSTIGNYVFHNCSSLPSLQLPQAIENLGEHIIAGCDNLTTLSIVGGENSAKTLKSHKDCIIDNSGRILYGCAAGTFPDDASIATSVGDYAFEGIETLLKLDIPDGFTSIEPRAFTGCSKLQEVFIPNSVTYIGANAFEDCYSLTAITLPFVGSGSRKEIIDSTFSKKQLFGSIFNDAEAENVPTPEGLVRVQQSLHEIQNNKTQHQDFLIPSNLKKVHITKTASQSDGMSGIPTEIIRLSNIAEIGPYFFAGNKMRRIDIDNNLKAINERAFENCEDLTGITLPPLFETIKNGAFYNTPALSQILVYANKWFIPSESTASVPTFHQNTSIYMATLPRGNTNLLPTNSYVARITGDRDFLGFWFNGLHSIDDLGVYRTGDGMHNASLTAKTETTTVNVPGSNGMYYFGTYDRSRAISVSFAFDHMTEKQLRDWKNLCSSKDLGELVFDEAPYKVYTAKITGTPKLQYIPFTENGERIYKGKGTIEFTCYYPYAHTPNSDTKMFKSLWTPINKNAVEPDFAVRGTCLDAYFDASFPTKNEWAAATGMPKEPTIGLNPGDMPAPFLLKTLAPVHNGTELYVGDAKITIKQDTTGPVHWDSRSGLVYTVDGSKKKPIYYSGNSIATIPVTDTPIEWSSIADLEYDYWYY